MSVTQGEAIARGAPLAFELIDLVSPWADAREPVLFYHGLGSVMQSWAEWLPHLTDRYRVLRFDVRGHGGSRESLDANPTLDSLGNDALAVADAAGIDRFHFVGESMGGTIGLRLARRRPDRVRSVTVCNSPYKGQALPSVEPIRAMMARGMNEWSAATMPMRFRQGEVSAEVWRWMEQTQANASGEFFLACLAMLGNVDLGDELSQIAQPVLILGGDSSGATPPALLAELRAKLPDARLQIFPGAGHGLAVSRGHDCGVGLRGFLDDISAR